MSELSSEFEAVPCALCGSEESEPVAEGRQHGLRCFVSICRRDGLVYLNPRWTPERYDHFYRHEYDRHYRPNAGRESDAARYGMICRIAEWMDVARAKPASILDVGAGMGWSLDHLSRLLPEAKRAAVEASPRCVAHLRSLGVEVLSTDVDGDWDTASAGAFDLVILRHVLEHTLDPVRVLRRIRNVLAPGGRLYVAVPDMMHPRGLLDTYWFRVVHTYYFSRPTLVCTLGRAGFDVARCRETEFADLWCDCTPADKPHHAPPPSAYHDQIEAIRRHRRREPAIRLRRGLVSLLGRMRPN